MFKTLCCLMFFRNRFRFLSPRILYYNVEKNSIYFKQVFYCPQTLKLVILHTPIEHLSAEMHKHCWSNVKLLRPKHVSTMGEAGMYLLVEWQRKRTKTNLNCKLSKWRCWSVVTSESPQKLLLSSPPDKQERWRQTPCDIQCVERLWQETLTAALCRSHWPLLELNPFFSILMLYNGLLPFWYISQAVPPAKMRVYAALSWSVCRGVCQTCGWRWRHELLQCFCCVVLGTSVPSSVGFLPPARTSETKNPLQTTHAFTFNDVSHIPLHDDAWALSDRSNYLYCSIVKYILSIVYSRYSVCV